VFLIYGAISQFDFGPPLRLPTYANLKFLSKVLV